ncbi:beta-induced protein ig-h3 [Seminavis robusta]|uniref:Beta-induced protein ig-h3 n=1 Tax=Seminavis robusta TaxID=568900 RepID=A0A9N8DPT5_9STRA|nr:beta-induced protein ig-h3 [Seminavis robusta]|eukprot:Sro199_g084510.1 beta-induced protein ig-h3 (208) ;mRNA; f:82273-82991
MDKLLRLIVAIVVSLELARGSSLRISGENEQFDLANGDGSKEAVQKAPSRDLGVWRWFYGPPSQPDIVETAIDAGLSTLVNLVGIAGLVDLLKGDGPFTVMAPTNQAFEALPAATVDLLKANMTALVNVLSYHVLPFQELRTFGNPWRSGGPFPTALANGNVTTSRKRSGRTGPLVKKVNGATVLESDVVAENGIVHVIDRVLIPTE